MNTEQTPKWPMFRRVWRREKLFESMAELLDVNLAAGARLDGGAAIKQANAICLRCPSTSECRSWIEAAEAGALPPDFCANSQFFKRCAEDRAEQTSHRANEMDRRTMKDDERLLAAVIYSADEGEVVDRILTNLADELKDQGFRIAGTVQRSIERPDRCACDMMVRDLSTDRELQISEDRGPNARGCRLDAHMLETLVGSTNSALECGVDAIIINKFGKREAQGAGFRGVIGQAILRTTPVIIAVNSAYLDSWRAFADGLADELKPDSNSLFDWVARRLRPDVIGREKSPSRPSLSSGL